MPRLLARALALTAAVLFLPLACRTTSNQSNRPDPKEVEYEVLFSEPDHEVEWCLKKALAEDYTTVTDSTIFFDRESTIRIKVPSGPSKEPYHAHLLHRRKDTLLQHLAVQGPDGAIEISLSKFEQPEILVLSSASMRMLDAKDRTALRDKPLLAPYAMSFRLAERQTGPTITSVQPFRYEWKYGTGTAALFVQSFCRSQMLLNLFDLDGKAGFLLGEGYYHSKDVNAYLTPHVLLDVRGATGETYQRIGTYSVAETAWRKDPKPFSLRFLDTELIAFAPPARVELSMPEQDPATSATVTARFEGVRPKSPLHFVLAAGYPQGNRERVGVRVQTDTVTAEKRDGTYVVSLDDLDPSTFPMTGYVAHRLSEPFHTPHGFYAPCEPLGRSTTPLFGDEDSLAKLHPKVLIPRYASHYDVIYWFGTGGGENEAKKFLLAYYSGTTPGGGPPGGGPSGTLIPPPTVPFVPGGGSGTTTTPGGGSGTTTPGGGGGSGSSGTGSTTPSPWWGLWLGPSGPPPDPGPSQPGTIAITIKCGCGMDNPGTAANECNCRPHMWTLGQIQQGIGQAAVSSCPQGFSVAETAWFGAHGDYAPCHTWTVIGMARVSYWGPNFSMVHVWYRVKVNFLPCKGNPPGGGGGGGGGKIGDGDGPGKPGDPNPRGDAFAALTSGTKGEPTGRVTELPGGGAVTSMTTAAWNPSTDPNAAVRLTELVAILRRGLGLSDLPTPTADTWTAPTVFLYFAREEFSSKVSDLVEWQKSFSTTYWGRREKRSPLPPTELRDVLYDWAIYGGADRVGGSFQGQGGGGDPIREHQ